jgi:hypothetical protein
MDNSALTPKAAAAEADDRPFRAWDMAEAK